MTSKLLGATLAASLAIGTVTTAATAGSLADPIVAPEIIVQQTTSSMDQRIIPPAMFVAFVAAAVILAPPFVGFSDARLKTDIVRVGTGDNGLPLYHFRYLGQSQVYEGVMAQDVLSHTPEAVSEIDGYLAVNYGMLGMEMRPVY